MDILIELVGVSDSTGHESLDSGDQSIQGQRIHTVGDVSRDTQALGIPTCWDLTSHEAIELEGSRNRDGSTLAQLHEPAACEVGEHRCVLFTKLALDFSGLLLTGNFDGLHVGIDGDVVEHPLLVRVVSLEELRLDDSNAAVLQDVLLVLALHHVVLNWLTGLGISPPHIVQVGIRLGWTVVWDDQAQEPSKLDATFHGEGSSGFDFPSGSSTAERTNFAKASNHDNLPQVHRATQLSLHRLPLWEFLLIGQRGELLIHAQRVGQRRGVECLASTSHGQGLLQGGLVVDGRAQVDGGLLEVVDLVPVASQVSPDRGLGCQGSHVRMQERHQVEGHLGGVEGSATLLLDARCHDVVLEHQPGACPPNDCCSQAEVVLPALALPLVEQRLATQLRLGVQAIVAKHAMVGGAGQQDHGRPSVDASLLLGGLDGTQEADQVRQHHPVSLLGPRVDARDVTAILRSSSEGNNEVQVVAQGAVDVVHDGIGVLGRGAIAGLQDELALLAAELLVDVLVHFEQLRQLVLGALDASGHNHGGTSLKKGLHDLQTDAAIACTSDETHLSSEGDTAGGDAVHTAQVLRGQGGIVDSHGAVHRAGASQVQMRD
mmetsp:Transcript_77960/g.170806  ORF Transcript_77960/g.170806 Transcript_77960/m.170806 type:complete len:602 (+) Transcript_77960:2114-3919(+)